jgi:membrane-associated phospholipid phosphatase
MTVDAGIERFGGRLIGQQSRSPSLLKRLRASVDLAPVAALRRIAVAFARVFVLVGSLVTLYLVRTPVPVWILGLAVAASLAAVYAVERRRPAFRLWALYVLGFTLFAHLRTLADETGVPVRVEYAVDLERTLFGGTVPTLWLQEQLYRVGSLGVVDVLAVATHLSYYVVPHLFAFVVWKVSYDRFRRHTYELLAAAYVGLAVSFALPTAPPWLAGQVGELPFVARILEDVGNDASADLYRQGYEIAGTNPVAAMPSLHMALTVVVAITAWRIGPRLGSAACLYAGAMGFSLVYLGEHYVVDVLAGVLTAVAVATVAAGLRRRAAGAPAGDLVVVQFGSREERPPAPAIRTARSGEER